MAIYYRTFLALFAVLPACLLTAAAARADEGTPVDVIGLYAQGFGFWSTVNQITQGGMSASDAIGLLNANFDQPQEGMTSLQVRAHGKVDGDLGRLFNEVYFGMGGDVLAGGLVTNRILPQVQAYDIYTAHVDVGLLEQVKRGASGLEYRLGSTVGAGKESLVNGSVVDLVNGPGQYTPENAAVFYTGLDLYLGYQSQYDAQISSHYRLSLDPTLFEADHSDSGTQYEINLNQWNFRWREENEWTLRLDSDYEPDVSFGLLTILGQQPTSISFLPRTWDAMHNIATFPSAGQLVGLGARLHVNGVSAPIGATLDGGFYGGYFGASATLHIYVVQLMAGTYGFEETSGYRNEESRIAFFSIGGRFEL